MRETVSDIVRGRDASVTYVMVGAVSEVTEWGRKPSGTNKIRLRWFCAPTAVICRKIIAHTVKRTDFEWSDTAVLLIFLDFVPR